MSVSDTDLAVDALHHLTVLRDHLTRGDLSDAVIADAVCLRLAAAIDSLARGSERLRTQVCGDEWHVVWATRNRIVHGYVDVDMNIVRLTVDSDLPGLERSLRDFLGN